jgi:hypothetical protein
VRSPRVWELTASMEYAERSGKSSPKLDLKVKMHTLCSIFIEIESTNDKYKYEYKCNTMAGAGLRLLSVGSPTVSQSSP